MGGVRKCVQLVLAVNMSEGEEGGGGGVSSPVDRKLRFPV